MKYLLLNSLKAGGAERVAQTLSTTGLFDSLIILEKDKDYDVSISIINISNHTYKTNSLYKTFYIPIYAWKLRKIIKKGDIVVSFAERANFTNIVLKFLVRQKVILTLHTNLVKSFCNKRKFLYFYLIKFLYLFADVIISVSKGIESNLEKIVHYKGIKKIIYNPICLNKLNDKEKNIIGIGEVISKSNIITFGRLSDEKAQWNLLRIFEDICQKRDGVKLLIIGDGPLRNKLVKYSKSLNLKTFSIFDNDKFDNTYEVYFLGYQENPSRFISSLSVFALTSTFEGLPLVILEAMACGAPVVSSDCDFGPREILRKDDKDFGILLPVLDKKFTFDFNRLSADEKKWSDTIIGLLDDEDKRYKYSALARERVQDFSLEKIKGDWVNLLNSL